MVFNGTRGQLVVNLLRGLHEEIITTASLAFWEAYLKDDAAAKKWLISGGFEGYVGDAGEYRHTVDSRQ